MNRLKSDRQHMRAWSRGKSPAVRSAVGIYCKTLRLRERDPDDADLRKAEIANLKAIALAFGR